MGKDLCQVAQARVALHAYLALSLMQEAKGGGGFDHEIFLAMALAFERSQGKNSAFYPYVRLLGEPPGLIFKSKAQIAKAIKLWGRHLSASFRLLHAHAEFF